MKDHSKQENTNLVNISSSKRIPELDGLRGLAIILVILYHYVAVPVPANAGLGFQILRQIFSHAWSGVDLFFVLSGFLIAGILIDYRDSRNFFKVFYLRRVNRIFPLYYTFLILFLVIQSCSAQWGLLNENIFKNPLPLTTYFLFLQNFSMAAHADFGNEFLAITWSLAVEEQFYLLLPLLVRFSNPQRLPMNVLFLIGIPVALRITLGSEWFFAYVLTPWRLDSLLLGSLLAIIIRTESILTFLKNYIFWIRIVFIFIFSYVSYISIREGLGAINHLFTFALFYTLLIFLILMNRKSVLARFFRNPNLAKIGLISYGIYIFHQSMNGILHEIFFRNLPSFHNAATILVTLLAFLVTYLAAFSTYHAFEKRFIAYGHQFKFSYDQSSSS